MYIKVQCPRDEALIIGGGAEEQVVEVMVVVVLRDPIAQFKILYHISHILLQITLCKRHREDHWILTFGCFVWVLLLLYLSVATCETFHHVQRQNPKQVLKHTTPQQGYLST
jgi:hypothetical protein